MPRGRIWAVGHFGTIIHSADGGKSWVTQAYDSRVPDIIDKRERAEASSDAVTAEEENQGAVQEARLNAVTFVDANNGWTVGEFGLVLHTDDGGETWKRQRSNVSFLLFAIRAIDQRRLVAVGSDGICIETDDGGLKWRAVNTGVSEHFLDIAQVKGTRYLVGENGLIMVQEDPRGSFRRVSLGSTPGSHRSNLSTRV